MGSQELYRWLDEEPQLFCPADVDYVHSPERISRMKHVISINGGVELDLMGQENAESAGSRQLSGTEMWIRDSCHGHSRAQRACGGLNACCVAVLRMSRCPGAHLSEIHQILLCEIPHPEQVKKRIEEHGSVAAGKDEAIPVKPVWVCRIIA